MDKKSINNLQNLVNHKKAGESFDIICVLCGKTRFKIALVLMHYREGLTVTELSKILNASLSRISHQLRILRAHKLVLARRKNREVIYKLANHRLKKFFPFN